MPLGESFSEAGATPPVGTNQTSIRRYFAFVSLSFTVWPLNSAVFGVAEVPQKWGCNSTPLSAAPAALTRIWLAGKLAQMPWPALMIAAAFIARCRSIFALFLFGNVADEAPPSRSDLASVSDFNSSSSTRFPQLFTRALFTGNTISGSRVGGDDRFLLHYHLRLGRGYAFLIRHPGLNCYSLPLFGVVGRIELDSGRIELVAADGAFVSRDFGTPNIAAALSREQISTKSLPVLPAQISAGDRLECARWSAITEDINGRRQPTLLYSGAFAARRDLVSAGIAAGGSKFEGTPLARRLAIDRPCEIRILGEFAAWRKCHRLAGANPARSVPAARRTVISRFGQSWSRGTDVPFQQVLSAGGGGGGGAAFRRRM